LHVVRDAGQMDVVGLLTTVTEPFDRVSMHGVRTDVLEAQAGAAGLPLVKVPIPAPCPNGVYEEAMGRAVERAKAEGVSHMVFGDLFLEDVRAYREKQLDGSGIEPVFPLWGQPTDRLAEEMIDAGVVAHVTCLDPAKVPRELAGSRFDRKFLAGLPAGADPCAERDGFVFTDLALADGDAAAAM
jgi:diphthamide synthase (EF-2-diphthine--ammonia ligase)